MLRPYPKGLAMLTLLLKTFIPFQTCIYKNFIHIHSKFQVCSYYGFKVMFFNAKIRTLQEITTFLRSCHIYRSVPLIRPPILYTTSSLKWGEGLYSNMQLVSSISPPHKSLRERYVHFQSSCLHKNTVTKAFYTRQLIQDREYCSWTSR